MTKRRPQRRATGFAHPQSVAIEGAVPHPRYGNGVVTTQTAATREVILNSFWNYRYKTFFPESALPANVDAQNRELGERPYYVDILNHCVDCKRPFLFFAREQQYVFEVLKFNTQVDFIRFPECRHSIHRVKVALRRYADLIHLKVLSDDELMHLAADLVLLFEAGAIQDEQRVRTVKNLAVRGIPDAAPTNRIVELVERLNAADP